MGFEYGKVTAFTYQTTIKMRNFVCDISEKRSRHEGESKINKAK